MDELITTKQVQEVLRVDRITIYRMIKDGRLNGIKVGNQWRFHRSDIEGILSGGTRTKQQSAPSEILPIHCISVIQDVFAEILNVGSVTTDIEGEPLSEISNSCDFCNLILESPSGNQACINSWKKLAQTPRGDPKFIQCHVGFQYARGRIEFEGKLISILIAGQFLISEKDKFAFIDRIESLSQTHNINIEKLKEASETIRILDSDHQAQIEKWLIRVAETFEIITYERGELLERLKTIAAMSTFEN